MTVDKKAHGAPPAKDRDRQAIPNQDDNLAPIKDPEKEPGEPEETDSADA